MIEEPWRLCVLTPSYFDVESFLILKDRLEESLGLAVARGELPAARIVKYTFVDDSAGRDAAVRALDQLPDVTVIEPPFNLGHQRAIVYGLRAIAGDLSPEEIVVTMDSDGEDQPEDVPRLLAPLLTPPVDLWKVAIARRTERHEPLAFKVMYLAFVLLFRLLTGRAVRSGNFAALRGEYVVRMLNHPYFDLCYSSSLLTLSMNPTPTFVPCARGRRYAGESRMGTERLLSHGVRMLMPFADRIAIRSLAFFTLLSGFTVGLLVILETGHLVWGLQPPIWTWWLLVVGAIGSSVALVNFLVLFSGFAQSSALALQRLDQRQEQHP
jgi:hypothetical protein